MVKCSETSGVVKVVLLSGLGEETQWQWEYQPPTWQCSENVLHMIRKSIKLLANNCGFFYFPLKKYQETLRKIEEELETRFLEREV